MRKSFALVTTFILLSQCTVVKPKHYIAPVIVPIIKTNIDTIKVIRDTVHTVVKYVQIPTIVENKSYYNHLDSILISRMNLYADSNKNFINSQSVVLADYKATLINNVKLIDSLKKVKQEKVILKRENTQKEQTINNIGNVDYYTASVAWGIMMVMLFIGLWKQHQILQEIKVQL